MWFEITKMLIAVLTNKFIVSFIIIFGTLLVHMSAFSVGSRDTTGQHVGPTFVGMSGHVGPCVATFTTNNDYNNSLAGQWDVSYTATVHWVEMIRIPRAGRRTELMYMYITAVSL